MKKLNNVIYSNLMDGISYYEMKFDTAPPELYAAARENTLNPFTKLKLIIKEFKSKRNK